MGWINHKIEYIKEENKYCEDQLKRFYSCSAPTGSLEKEALRAEVSRAREEFRKSWSQSRDRHI